jgi:hypothetical protein
VRIVAEVDAGPGVVEIEACLEVQELIPKNRNTKNILCTFISILNQLTTAHSKS